MYEKERKRERERREFFFRQKLADIYLRVSDNHYVIDDIIHRWLHILCELKYIVLESVTVSIF